MERERSSSEITRRQLLRLGSAAAFAGAAGSGLIGWPLPPSEAQAAGPKIKRGGVLRTAKDFRYPTLDAHLNTLVSLHGYRMLYDCLLRHELNAETGRFEMRPELAESWECVNERTFVFRLRTGVKFHDGSDFNAEVAKWNLDRMRQHPKSGKKDDVTAIQSVDVAGQHVIRVTLRAPTASLLANLSAAAGRAEMISKAAVDKLGDDQFGRQPVGTGPMQFVEWLPDERLVLKRFDGYWQTGTDGKPLPYLDGAVFRVMTDPAVAILELRAGTLDLTDGVEAKDVARIKTIPDLVYREIPQSAYIYFTVGFNQKAGPFAQNPKLRQAALHAINREAMAKVLGFGQARPHDYPFFGPGMIGYDESLPRYEFNPVRVRELLREAGHPNGVDVTLTVINRAAETRIAEVAKQMWDAQGIRTTLEVFERLAWIQKVKAFDFQACFMRSGTSMDPDLTTRNLSTGAPGNWSSWSNTAFDRCLDEGRSTYDDRARHEIYKRCLRILHDEAFVSAGFLIPQNVVHVKSVKGIRIQSTSPFALLDFRETWLDR
jgi:peptide/nickel transport system substrate-binding protein